MASRTALVYNSSLSLDTIETFTYRHSRDVFNRLRLSRIIEEARHLASKRIPVYVSDVDSLMMQYLDSGQRRRFVGFEFKNMRPEVAFRGAYVKVNGKQYELHYYFTRVAGIKFYYLIRAGRKYLLWDIGRTPVHFDWWGSRERGTYDYYAFVPKEDVAILEEEELPRYLSELVFEGGRG